MVIIKRYLDFPNFSKEHLITINHLIQMLIYPPYRDLIDNQLHKIS